MSRLAKGLKAPISQDAMLELTSKNYALLPEVVKKREEQKKKDDMLKRIQLVKQLEHCRRSARGSR
jgi:hypothetical protein